MSTDVYKKYSQPPAKRAELLKLVEYYVNQRPKWTPAEGALLVNGVIPPPQGCKDIPELGDGVHQLDDPDLPATQAQLNGAKRILQDYLTHVEDGDLPPGDEVISDDFLKWCYDSDQAPWNIPKLPEFLRHLYFPGGPEHPFTLSVADELASLNIMIAAENALNGHFTLNSTTPITTRPEPVLENDTGLSPREKRIRAIEAAVIALGLRPKELIVGKPHNTRKKIEEECRKRHPKLFPKEHSFEGAWDNAKDDGRIIVLNNDEFSQAK